MSQFISLPLSKFSWATDPANATTFSWRHTSQNLILVFDTFRSDGRDVSSSQQNQQTMKVVQGANVLVFDLASCVQIGFIDTSSLTLGQVTTNIFAKAQESQRAIEQSKQFNIKLRGDQLPTAALYRTKTSTIAIRYPADEGSVRLPREVPFLQVANMLTGTSRAAQIRFRRRL